MDKILQIVKRKPIVFLFLSIGYVVAVALIKWQIAPPITALWFVAGAVFGTYFMDIAEVFFNLSPSPFRTIVFAAAYIVVSLFVVTSSGSMLASGLVLSLFLTLVLWQVGEWQVHRNLNSWYRMVAVPVTAATQGWLLVGFIAVFLIETWLFIRW